MPTMRGRPPDWRRPRGRPPVIDHDPRPRGVRNSARGLLNLVREPTHWLYLVVAAMILWQAASHRLDAGRDLPLVRNPAQVAPMIEGR